MGEIKVPHRILTLSCPHSASAWLELLESWSTCTCNQDHPLEEEGIMGERGQEGGGEGMKEVVP